MPEFYTFFARKIFFPIFFFFLGGGKCPQVPLPRLLRSNVHFLASLTLDEISPKFHR